MFISRVLIFLTVHKLKILQCTILKYAPVSFFFTNYDASDSCSISRIFFRQTFTSESLELPYKSTESLSPIALHKLKVLQMIK